VTPDSGVLPAVLAAWVEHDAALGTLADESGPPVAGARRSWHPT